jgi:hypothetical protein
MDRRLYKTTYDITLRVIQPKKYGVPLKLILSFV